MSSENLKEKLNFKNELEFQDHFVELLKKYKWQYEVLQNPTEKDLIENWKKIIFQNNRQQSRLNNVELTDLEMKQILTEINKTEYTSDISKFVNNGSVTITRDNEADKENFGKNVSLILFKKGQIGGGDSTYQIANQPIFANGTYRGDLLLIINGMPFFHIELKNSDVNLQEGLNQVRKYSKNGVYTGIFSLIQIIVVAKPNEFVYFARPSSYELFRKEFYFQWSDEKNNIYGNWKDLIKYFLSIPMAHKLISYYTVSDDSTKTLKVLRPYQYHAVSSICKKLIHLLEQRKSNLSKTEDFRKGGFIWHTTGSGKTLTSFKTAELISNNLQIPVDKVVILVDRVDLANQSLVEYKNFSESEDEIQGAKNARDLFTKLADKSFDTKLIISSIQKLHRGLNPDNLSFLKNKEKIQDKTIVFIVDECHRSTFGKMLKEIKDFFVKAVFFGFTGTPVYYENLSEKDLAVKLQTEDIFGSQLHSYNIYYALRDKNVLPFHIHQHFTYDPEDLAKQINQKKFNNLKETNKYVKNFDEKFYTANKEVFIKNEEHISYEKIDTYDHYNHVVNNILEGFNNASSGRELHAIFAVSSIEDAIKYYELFQNKDILKQHDYWDQNNEKPILNVTAMFDWGITGSEKEDAKDEAIKLIIKNYNEMFKESFQFSDKNVYRSFQSDVALRLAHKESYTKLNKDETKENQIDILIVVDQFLTGYDSKYVNTLYLDKVMNDKTLVQAFSRTNRIWNNSKKPFGLIKYYRYPCTMERNIESAISKYSNNDWKSVLFDKQEASIKKINESYSKLKEIFDKHQETPETLSENEIKQFIESFRNIQNLLKAIEIQGFDLNSQEDAEKLKFPVSAIAEWKNLYSEINTKHKSIVEKTDLEIELKLHSVERMTIINKEYIEKLWIQLQEEVKKNDNPQQIEQTIEKLKDKVKNSGDALYNKYGPIFFEKFQDNPDKFIEKEFQVYINETIEEIFTENLLKFCAYFGIKNDKIKMVEKLFKTIPSENELKERNQLTEITKEINWTETPFGKDFKNENPDAEFVTIRKEGRKKIEESIINNNLDAKSWKISK